MQIETLSRLCLTKTAITILELPEIKGKLSSLVKTKKFWGYKESNDRWQKVRQVLEDHIDKLQVSKESKECLKYTITPISLEMMNWMETFFKLNCIYKKIFEDLVWDVKGFMNDLETVKKMLKRRELKLNTRVYLACLFCVEQDVRNLWIINGSFKASFPDFQFKNDSVDKIITYWLFHITSSNSNQDDNEILQCLNIAIQCGIFQAVKYFFNKLSATGKNEDLLRKCLLLALTGVYSKEDKDLNFPCSSKTKIIIFLLEQAAARHFNKIFRDLYKTGSVFLNVFFSYPFRNFYLKYMKNCVGHFDDEQCFLGSLSGIAVRIAEDPEVYDKAFKYLWDEFCRRGYPVNSLFQHDLLMEHLLRFRSYKNVDSILDNVSVEDKEHFIEINGRNIAETLFYEKQSQVLEEFLKKCISSKEAAIRFKNEEYRNSELLQVFCPIFKKEKKLKMIRPWHELLRKIVASYD